MKRARFKVVAVMTIMMTGIVGCGKAYSAMALPIDTPEVALIEEETTVESVEIEEPEVPEVVEPVEPVVEEDTIDYEVAGEYVCTAVDSEIYLEPDFRATVAGTLDKEQLVEVESLNVTKRFYNLATGGYVLKCYLMPRAEYEEMYGKIYTATLFEEPKTLYCQEYSNFRVRPEADAEVNHASGTNTEVTVVGTCNEDTGWYLVEDGTWTLVTNLGENKVVIQTPVVNQAPVANQTPGTSNGSNAGWTTAYDGTVYWTSDLKLAEQRRRITDLVLNEWGGDVFYC